MTSKATIDATAAGRRQWEVTVVGAGPAGAMAARQLATEGLEVLLIDRQEFPRPKVCGGCLNGRTLGLLSSVGLGSLAESRGALPLDRFELWAGRRGADLRLPRGACLSRAALDAALVEEAVAAGADFLPGARAALGPLEGKRRIVRLPATGTRIATRVVLAADGLGGGFLSSHRGAGPRPAPSSRLGAGAEVELGPGAYRAGTIYMAVGHGGYVGLARVEGGRLNLAAALAPELVRRQGGLDAAVRRLLLAAGLPPVAEAAGRWRGTPPLTHKPRALSHERVLLLGDAAGYVEPFTGEGISWALESAVAVAPLAARAVEAWTPAVANAWEREHGRRIGSRQRWCRAVAWWLRRPALVGVGARALTSVPRLAAPLVAHLNAPAPAGERT